MTDGKMPEWPERHGDEDGNWGVALRYEHALAAAWEARLRLLVDACEDEGHVLKNHPTCFICKALDAIGELPKP